MLNFVNVPAEIAQLESDWINYTNSYKGRYSPMNTDLSVTTVNMHVVSIETRLYKLEEAIERLINITRSSKNIERDVIDKIIAELKD